MLHFRNRSTKQRKLLLMLLGLAGTAVLGSYFLSLGHAATPFISAEPENGTLSNGAVSITDTSASSSKAVTFSAPPPPSGMVPTGISGTWTLKFDDEFNGTSLDTTRWSSMEGGHMNNVTTHASNIAVSGGNLVLTLASSSSGAEVSSAKGDGAGANGYTLPVGGIAEARVYFPGNGTSIFNWPAWWTSGPNWPAAGEHDIAEGLGTLTVNYHSSSGSHNQGTIPGTWSNAFHIYTLHRLASRADVFWDGNLVKSYSTDDNGGAHSLLLNVGSGNTAAYGASGAIKVDYVRAWE